MKSDRDAASAAPALRREIIFRDGTAQATVEIPPTPQVCAPRPIRLLGRDLGTFPHVSGQTGTWLLCDCLPDVLQGYRVASSDAACCSQCDRPNIFLYCGCGVLSRHDANAADASCLLCGSPRSDRHHRCRRLPGRSPITLTASATSCFFCHWPQTHLAKNGARESNKRGETSQDHAHQTSVENADAEIDETAEADPRHGTSLAPGERGTGSLSPTRHHHQRSRAFLLLAAALVAGLGLVLLFGLVNAKKDTPTNSTTLAGSLAENPPRRIHLVPTVRWPHDPDETIPVPDLLPADEIVDQENRHDTRHPVPRLAEALRAGDLQQLTEGIKQARRTRQRSPGTDPAGAELIELAEATLLLANAVTQALGQDFGTMIESWDRLQRLSPAFAAASPLAHKVNRIIEARFRHPPDERRWDAFEQDADLLTTHLSDHPIRARIEQTRRAYQAHRTLLGRATDLHADQPHLGLLFLASAKPPAALALAHERVLNGLRARLTRLDQQAPSIESVRLTRKRSRSDPLRFIVVVHDDYAVDNVAFRYRLEKSKPFKALTPLSRAGNEREQTWTLELAPEAHGGRKIELSIDARDPSGHQDRLHGWITKRRGFRPGPIPHP